MKTCTKCDIPKEDNEFSKRGKGLQSKCKLCHSLYRKEHYEKNKAKYINKAKVRTKNERLKIIEYLKSHPCVDCGNNDVRVLHFDHLDRSTKLLTVSKAVGSVSKERLWEEIAKCVVRCANCHMIRTSGQLNWLKADVV